MKWFTLFAQMVLKLTSCPSCRVLHEYIDCSSTCMKCNVTCHKYFDFDYVFEYYLHLQTWRDLKSNTKKRALKQQQSLCDTSIGPSTDASQCSDPQNSDGDYMPPKKRFGNSFQWCGVNR